MNGRTWIVVAALATLGACSSGAKSWEQVKRDKLDRYENVLVVGLNESHRAEWEDAIVAILHDLKVRGTPSHTLLVELADANEPAFAERVRAGAFEGIVTVRVSSARDDERLSVTPDSWVGDVVAVQASASTTEDDFRLEIVLFDCQELSAQDWNPVWAGRSATIAADVAPGEVGQYVVGVLKEQSLF